MGKRNRERIARIRASIEKPFRAAGFMKRAVSGDPEAMAELEAQVVKKTGLSKSDITPGGVAAACRFMKGLIRIQGVPVIRQQVQNHLPDEIRRVKASGREPFEFYWNIPDFRLVWAKLGWNEEDLHSMIEGATNACTGGSNESQ